MGYKDQVAEIPGLIARDLEIAGSAVNFRFSVVGFGGRDNLARPHIVTSGNRIFSTAEHTTTTLKTSYQQNGEGVSDIYSALKYTVDRLPYRPGASKTVVLVTCDDEGHDDGGFYGDAMTMLQLYDVNLHHLTPMDVQLRSKASKKASKAKKITSKVLGFAGDAAIALVPNEAGHELSRGLKRQLANPKDYLSTLALNNGGSVLDAKKMDKAVDRWTAKRAAQAAARLIAAGGRRDTCQECHCWPTTASGEGQLKCQKCILRHETINNKFNRINLLKEISLGRAAPPATTTRRP